MGLTRAPLATAAAIALVLGLAGCAVTSPMPVPKLAGSYTNTTAQYGQGSKNLRVVASAGKVGIAFNCEGDGQGTVTMRPAIGKLVVTCDPPGHAGTGSVNMTAPVGARTTLALHVRAAAGTQWVIVIGTQNG